MSPTMKPSAITSGCWKSSAPAGKAGLSKSELIRRTQFVDKRQREEILVTLVEAGW